MAFATRTTSPILISAIHPPRLRHPRPLVSRLQLPQSPVVQRFRCTLVSTTPSSKRSDTVARNAQSDTRTWMALNTTREQHTRQRRPSPLLLLASRRACHLPNMATRCDTRTSHRLTSPYLTVLLRLLRKVWCRVIFIQYSSKVYCYHGRKYCFDSLSQPWLASQRIKSSCFWYIDGSPAKGTFCLFYIVFLCYGYIKWGFSIIVTWASPRIIRTFR